MTEQTLTKSKPAFQLKGSLFTLTLMQIKNSAVDAIEEQLSKLIHQTPKFFNNTPIVLDCHPCLEAGESIDLPAMIACLRQYHLIPVGVRAGNELLEQAALSQNLAVFPLSRHEQEPAEPTTDAKKPTPQRSMMPPVSANTKLITQPIRSGQQIYARNGDLIVLSSVSHGAELLADGNIHVYGTLRGRALAGVQGDTQARIFCKKLEPELIAIAGHYQLNDHLTEEHIGPVQIYLEENTLRIEPV